MALDDLWNDLELSGSLTNVFITLYFKSKFFFS